MEENKFIPLSVPNLRGNELVYAEQAITTGWVSARGVFVEQFEHKIAEYAAAKGAVACQSGTAGIHTALLVLGITPEDMVIVPTLTFIAAANPVKYIGAEPVFMDCDDSFCIDPDKLQEFCEKECNLTKNKLIHTQTKKVIKALIVVHVFGNMADMEKIMQIAQKYHFAVIEDATEALGTYYQDGIFAGKYAGTIGDIGVYSFNGNKIITTGGGGMIVSDNEDLLKHAKHLTTQAKSDELYYLHDEIGFNYRMTNLQAAVGVAQLEELEEFIQIKNSNYDLYKQYLRKDIQLCCFREKTRSNKWFYSILCHERQERDYLIRQLEENKIQTRPVWGLLHMQKPYQGSYTYNIEKAYYYQDRVVNIPCSTNLQEDDVIRTAKWINQTI